MPLLCFEPHTIYVRIKATGLAMAYLQEDARSSSHFLCILFFSQEATQLTSHDLQVFVKSHFS